MRRIFYKCYQKEPKTLVNTIVYAQDSDVSCDKFVVDNCKNIYIAGHETVALTTSWCLMLLAAQPEWQDRARAEVLEICKDGIPEADMI